MRVEPATQTLHLPDKLARLSWSYVILIVLIGLVGYAMLYSAGGGSHQPWAWRHAVGRGRGRGARGVVGGVGPRVWLRAADGN